MYFVFFYFYVSLMILFRTAILVRQCDRKTLNIWKRNFDWPLYHITSEDISAMRGHKCNGTLVFLPGG